MLNSTKAKKYKHKQGLEISLFSVKKRMFPTKQFQRNYPKEIDY